MGREAQFSEKNGEDPPCILDIFEKLGSSLNPVMSFHDSVRITNTLRMSLSQMTMKGKI